MSAVLKELALVEPKNLTEALVFQEFLPQDFYENDIYDQRLDYAIQLSSNLVYNLDDEGEKQAKSDATSINKFATQFDKFTAATFKAKADEFSVWRSEKKEKIKQLQANRQKLIDQFEEKRKERLNEVRKAVETALIESLDLSNIKPEFRQDFSVITPLIKLAGTLTPTGALTKSASAYISGVVAEALAEQNRIEARDLLVENRCLRAEINPPLTRVHFGTVFFADDAIFNEKLNDLIHAEINRKAEMEARIKKQQEAENQRKIEEALKAQQAESDRLAREKLEAERQADYDKQAQLNYDRANEVAKKELEEKANKPTPESLRESANRIEQSAQYADRASDKRREESIANQLRSEADTLEKAQKTEKRTVNICVQFSFENISTRVSNEAVVNHLKSLLEPYLNEKLLKALIGYEVK